MKRFFLISFIFLFGVQDIFACDDDGDVEMVDCMIMNENLCSSPRNKYYRIGGKKDSEIIDFGKWVQDRWNLRKDELSIDKAIEELSEKILPGFITNLKKAKAKYWNSDKYPENENYKNRLAHLNDHIDNEQENMQEGFGDSTCLGSFETQQLQLKTIINMESYCNFYTKELIELKEKRKMKIDD